MYLKFSAKIAFVITAVFIVINYIAQKYNLIPNSDISEIPIVASLYSIYYSLFLCN